jgi:hypothetical protein
MTRGSVEPTRVLPRIIAEELPRAGNSLASYDRVLAFGVSGVGYFRLARNPPGINAKRVDHFLQAASFLPTFSALISPRGQRCASVPSS